MRRTWRLWGTENKVLRMKLELERKKNAKRSGEDEVGDRKRNEKE